MAHEIKSMMYAGETPWHGLGTYVGDQPVKSAEAMQAAGLIYTVEKQPLFVVGKDGILVEVPDQWGVWRSDGSVLGVVGGQYEHVQDEEAFNFLDSLVEEGQMRYHTAGSLKGGKVTFILAQLPGVIQVTKQDEVHKYLLLVNSHDGSLKLCSFFTPVRVVCMNTLRAAIAQSAFMSVKGKDKRRNVISTEGIALRHTRNVRERLEEGQKVLRAGILGYQSYEEFLKALGKKKMPDPDFQNFALNIMGVNADVLPSELHPRRRVQYEQLQELFEAGVGQDIPGVRGTAWAALNAVTEYLSFHKTTRISNGVQDTEIQRRENRLVANWMGESVTMAGSAQQYLYNYLAA